MKKEIVRPRHQQASEEGGHPAVGGGPRRQPGLRLGPAAGRSPDRSPLVSVARQTKLVLDNVKACLEAAGSSLDKVVKCTVYITNAAYFDEVNDVYRKYFKRDRRRACSAPWGRGRSSTWRSNASPSS